MFQIPQLLGSPDGLGWGQKARFDIDGGRTFHEILLESDTLTAANILWVTLTLNGDQIIRLTGADLVMLEQYRKRYVTPGVFVLYLSDIVNANMDSRGISALVTFPTDQITLEVEVGAGAGAIDLKASAQVSAAQDKRLVVPRKFRQNINAGQTNENTWDKLTRGPAVQRIHLQAPITRLEWKKDKLSVWERTAALNVAMLKRMDRAPQAGYFHFDAIESDFGIADLFSTIVRESLVMKYDISAPGNVPMLIEALEQVATADATA